MRQSHIPVPSLQNQQKSKTTGGSRVLLFRYAIDSR